MADCIMLYQLPSMMTLVYPSCCGNPQLPMTSLFCADLLSLPSAPLLCRSTYAAGIMHVETAVS